MDQKLRRKAEQYDSLAKSRENTLTRWAYTSPQWRAERLLDTLMAINPAQLVEVGCGAGLLARAWRPGTTHYTGIDISLGMLGLTHRAAPQAVLVRAAAERLPFADKSLECVVCDCTIQVCVDREAAMREIKRVARSWLIVSHINRARLAPMIEGELKSGFDVIQTCLYDVGNRKKQNYVVYVARRSQ